MSALLHACWSFNSYARSPHVLLHPTFNMQRTCSTHHATQHAKLVSSIQSTCLLLRMCDLALCQSLPRRRMLCPVLLCVQILALWEVLDELLQKPKDLNRYLPITTVTTPALQDMGYKGQACALTEYSRPPEHVHLLFLAFLQLACDTHHTPVCAGTGYDTAKRNDAFLFCTQVVKRESKLLGKGAYGKVHAIELTGEKVSDLALCSVCSEAPALTPGACNLSVF